MFSVRDYKLFAVAKALAETSTHDKAHIGAVIVDGREIISVGVNGRKSHPMQQKYNHIRFGVDDNAQHLMHAEIDAIVKGKTALHRADKPEIFVYRQMKNGVHGISRPCVGCLQALKDFEISNVYYTTGDGFVYEQLTSN